ncbi:hydrogenase maturation protease [Streptosporangium sp. NBC_01755]|uniref:hydrogenase maturation protease n=1 Tax=unclassified Streptosporangium TaxID=2632669 RepID=UPI002DD8C251|nr:MULTISPECIES: hydrogenase maturation protease [unclassified Streptosporangium]WSA25183.1 hydrogenase maturation protease [Streptosporangium sp. NBC_01810]WSD03477.1 hydrogenase maturation protease [Streptosporangium sp. NBC_01755]
MRADRVVIGVGGDSRGDDAAGLEVVRLLRGTLPPSVVLTESSGDPMHLVTAWSGARLAIVIDAVSSGAAPGTIHTAVRPGPAPAWRASSHALGLPDAMALGEALGLLPDELVVFGVEGGDFGLDTPVTPPVRAAIRETAEAVRQRLDDLRQQEQ